MPIKLSESLGQKTYWDHVGGQIWPQKLRLAGAEAMGLSSSHHVLHMYNALSHGASACVHVSMACQQCQ